MGEKKTLIRFEAKEEKIWVKDFGNRSGVQFILLAELPDDNIFYAATIESALSKRYQKNRANEVESVALVKKKGNEEKFLQISFGDGKMVTLRDEDYFLLIHLPNNEECSEDYILIFNKPCMIGQGAHFQIFSSDAKNGNAIALFWMLKDFIAKGRSEIGE